MLVGVVVLCVVVDAVVDTGVVGALFNSKDKKLKVIKRMKF